LEHEKLPPELASKDIWDKRFRDIRGWERYLENNGVVVRKFFLHLSREQQKRRFLERIDNPAKNWKFSATDAQERRYWKDYMRAYEDMTATPPPSAPRGTSSRPTTSGSRESWSGPPSSTRSTLST